MGVGPVRVALIGCGGIGHCHARAIAALPTAQLVATVDVEEERARQFARQYGAEVAATDLRVVLDRPDLDAVIVTTANDTHASLSLQALEAGKHVLVQKPISLTLDQADAMIEAADRAGKVLMVSFFEFFHPAFMRAKELIDTGKIGELFLFQAIMAWYMPRTDAWRFDPAVAGGGILMDGHVHHVALFNWFLGEPAIQSVYTELGTLASDARVEDTAVTLLRTDRTIGEISGSNRLQEPNAQNGGMFKESVELFGTEGTIHIHPTERPSLKVFTKTGLDETLSGGWIAPRLSWVPYDERGRSLHFNPEEDPWVGEHRHFVHCIRHNLPVVSDGRFGRRVLQVLLAGYQSAREGRAIRLAGGQR